MTKRCTAQLLSRWMIVVLALGASALLLMALWVPLTPFDALLDSWGVHIFATLSHGMLMTRAEGLLHVILRIALISCFLMPFWGLRHIAPVESRWFRSVVCLLALGFVVLAAMSAVNSASLLQRPPGWDSWQIAEVGINAYLGVLLAGLGLSLKQAASLRSTRLRRIRHGLWIAGLAIASYFFLPIGLIALVFVYLNIGLLLLRHSGP